MSLLRVVFLLLSCNILPSEGQTIAQFNSLSSTLLTGYNKHTRPTNNVNTAVTVNAFFSLIAIREFNEVQEKFSTVILFDLHWFDESFVWDPATNNNIYLVTMSQNDVWKPLLTLSNPQEDIKELGNKDWVTVLVNSSGYVFWSPLAVLDSTCGINTKYYPYDSQQCKLQMYTFGYGNTQVSINPMKSTLDTTYYEGHATWKTTSTNVASEIDTNGGEFLNIYVNLERQPTFIIVNFLIPIFVLALLNPLVFLLPIDSGERIGFSITILLSLSVFMTILGDYIPQNANPMSLCAFMLMSMYICSSVILFFVILSSNVYLTPETKPVNQFAKAFERVFSGRWLKRNKVDVGNTTLNKSQHNVHELFKKTDTDKCVSEREHPVVSPETVDWKDVSNALDNVCFVLMYVSVILVLIVFVALMKRG